MIRTLIVDDQQLVRSGLRMLLGASPDIELVGEAADGQRAVLLAAQLRPDVILMDLRMPGLDGVAATRAIVAAHPEIRVVVLTTFDDDEHLYPALRAGAGGFLAKDTPPEALLDGVRRAADGDNPFSPQVLRRVVRRAVATPEPAAPELPLTGREGEVLDLVAAGLSNAEIAEALHIGVTTVKTHVGNLMTKTASRNRVQLAVFAERRLP